MNKTHIIEASSFTQTRATFNLPEVMAQSIKLCHLGVYGQQGFPLNPILGQVNVIKSITLRAGGTTLSQYDRNVHNLLEYKYLKEGNVKHRNIYKQLLSSNFGCVLNNGGANSASQADGTDQGAALTPRVSVDKHSLKQSQVAEADSDLACLNLADVLGWCNAVFTEKDTVISGVMPLHLYPGLKLTIEFNAPATVCANATQVAQPYLIVEEVEDPILQKQFDAIAAGGQVLYSDSELESVFLSGADSKVFLNGFQGKTLSQLVLMIDNDTFSPAQDGEVFRLLVNNKPLLNLTSGINHPGKKAAMLRMQGIDLYQPLFSDRTFANNNGGYTAGCDTTATSIYDGPANSGPEQTSYYIGRCSYLSLPIGVSIDKLQIDYTRGGVAPFAPATLLFWGEVSKVQQWGKDSVPVVMYV